MKIIKALAVASLLALVAQPAFAAGSLMKVLEYFDPAGPSIPNFVPQVAPLKPDVEQTSVDFSLGAAQSVQLNDQTRLVMIECSARCSFKAETGTSTVTTSNTWLAADSPIYFSVSPASKYKISVIASP